MKKVQYQRYQRYHSSRARFLARLFSTRSLWVFWWATSFSRVRNFKFLVEAPSVVDGWNVVSPRGPSGQSAELRPNMKSLKLKIFSEHVLPLAAYKRFTLSQAAATNLVKSFLQLLAAGWHPNCTPAGSGGGWLRRKRVKYSIVRIAALRCSFLTSLL